MRSGIWAVVLLLPFYQAPGLVSPGIAIDPATITQGRETQVKVRLPEASADTRVSLAPGGPIVTGRTDLPKPVRASAVHGDRVLMATAEGLFIAPLAEGEPLAANRLPGAQARYQSLAVHGNRLYALDQAGVLTIFNLTASSARIAGTWRSTDTPRAVYIHNGHAYLAGPEGVTVASLARPAQPQQVAHFDPGASVRALAAHQDRLILALGQDGVAIIDVTHPDRPRLTHRFATTGPALDLAVTAGRLYVASGASGLVILGLNEGSPRWLGSHSNLGRLRRVISAGDQQLIASNTRGDVHIVDVAKATHPTVINSQPLNGPVVGLAWRESIVFAIAPGQLWRIAMSGQRPALSNEGLDLGEGVNFGGQRRAVVQDGLAYVADWFSGIHIYDVRSPRRPRLLSSLPTPGSPKGIWIADGYAYVADDDHGLQVIDVSEPRRPRQVANLAVRGLAYTPVKVGDRLYLASHRGGFQIIDISEPTDPRRLGRVDTPGMAWSLAVSGETVFVADDNGGLRIYDAGDPTQPRQLAVFDPEGRAEEVRVRDGIAYVAFFDQGLRVIDITTPSEPRPLAHLATPGNARGLELRGETLYIADWRAGVHAVDVATPAQPRRLGSYDTRGAAWGVRVAGAYAYVLDWWGGLTILDVTDSTHLRHLASYHTRGRVRQVAGKGHYLYAAQGAGGVQVYDRDNPLNPTWVTGVDLPAGATRVALSDDLALVTGGEGGLYVIDIVDPVRAHPIGHLDILSRISALRIHDRHAYLIDHRGRMLVVALTDPADPQIVGRYGGQNRDLWVDDRTLYMITATNTLTALDITHPAFPDPLWRQPLRHTPHQLRVRDGRFYMTTEAQGLQIMERIQDQLRTVGTVPLPNASTDMALGAERLYLVGDRTVETIDLRHQRRGPTYPLLSRATSMTFHQGHLYLAGEPLITALQPLPAIPSEQAGATFTLRLPKTLPQGSYDLLIQGSNSHRREPNALTVTQPGFGKPSFTQ